MKLLGKGITVNSVAIAAGSKKRTVVYRGSQEKRDETLLATRRCRVTLRPPYRLVVIAMTPPVLSGPYFVTASQA